jgi:release factor glutamine methyltransferase
MTIQEAEKYLSFQMADIYEKREAATIADWVMESITGWKKLDRIARKDLVVAEDSMTVLRRIKSELVAHRPVQYVLQEAYFCGLKLYVDENVLIPRPETEELVVWVLEYIGKAKTNLRILDVGTGSGCIPIAIKKKQQASTLYACDISQEALEIAEKNAGDHNTSITFLQTDILNPPSWHQLPDCDIIVSNPPYIPVTDKINMRQNVLLFEPHIALFASDQDPLIFYKMIADCGNEILLPEGKLFVEIHEDSGENVAEIFRHRSYVNIEIRKDLYGKERMVTAQKK